MRHRPRGEPDGRPPSFFEFSVGASVVTMLCVFHALALGLPSILLSAGLVVSFAVWGLVPFRAGPRAIRLFGIAIALFAAHVAEETLTGFYESWPALFGRPPWTAAEFLRFNFVWLALFAACFVTLRRGTSASARVAYRRGASTAARVAVLLAIFMALVGGVGNGIVHLGRAFAERSYVPGAATALPLLVVGGMLTAALFRDPDRMAGPGEASAPFAGAITRGTLSAASAATPASATPGAAVVIYEVNLDVDGSVAADFRAWLDVHVGEMLDLPGFIGATVYAVEDRSSQRGESWTVQYRLRSREDLDAYFERHAERMRRDGERRFGGRFDATRRILRPEAETGGAG